MVLAIENSLRLESGFRIIISIMDIKLQVGVKIFLQNEDGKYLLVKRSSEKYKMVSGNWDIVGGRIDPGSKLIDNLRREVMEETQLTITSEPILIAAQDIIPSPEKHIVRLSYIGKTKVSLSWTHQKTLNTNGCQ